MPRPKRKPYNPAAKVHDRRSTDLLRNAQVAAIEIDDPYGINPEDKIVTLRSIRNDPLARLHAHHQIDEAQYWGGRAYQEDFECAERGPQAIDPSKEYVDGGRMPEPITESMRRSILRLGQADRKLGQDGCALTRDVVIHGLTMTQICNRRGMPGLERDLGAKFQGCLHILAYVYGFSKEETGMKRIEVNPNFIG